MAIEIVSSRTDWRDAFSELAVRLRRVAPAGARLHHIGSTAVPGLPAKDVIDLQLGIASLDAIDPGALATIGFIERVGLRDHAPMGRDVPPSGLDKRFFKSSQRAANLHVRMFRSFNYRYPLLCRDYLRAHPAAAAAYGAFKVRLAALTSEHDAYADTKDPVFDLIMIGAEDWAAHSGWREPAEDF